MHYIPFSLICFKRVINLGTSFFSLLELKYWQSSLSTICSSFCVDKLKRSAVVNFFCNLQDAVDCPEWVVPFHLFKLLAEEVLSCSLALTVTKYCVCLNRQKLLVTTHCFWCLAVWSWAGFDEELPRICTRVFAKARVYWTDTEAGCPWWWKAGPK